MTLEHLVKRSDQLHTAIVNLLEGVPVYSGVRHEVAMVACGISFEHALGLRILFNAKCPTSAVAMLRLQFEALARAMWLLYAASDLAVEKLTAPLTLESERIANKLPMVGEMVSMVINKAPRAASQMLAQFKDVSGTAMNSFVHTGIHSLRRSADGFPLELVMQAIKNSNGLDLMTGMLAAILTGDERVTKPMQKLQGAFFDCLPPLNFEEQVP